MLLRERETPEGRLVSVCDADCLGETYEDGPVTLTVSEEFYGGDGAVEATEAEVIAGLRRAQVANIVGTEAVGVAVEAGLVDEETVLEFEETRHAQLLWL
ncbi:MULTISPECIES: DUF424 domain-containing protein [Halorubrum]|uniref:DUF424 domain-containing protein n=1 Tax=Halorubrum sodomense TaxID=35743 RepID=A0A1I6FK12_HALSD|nr:MULTISPECIES: DUF424 domain-containing protein [Halorubrum]TKX54101.1 DUF424 domain-containing protein [Halorubrum sp. SP3]TKX68962.1 DUF424 domain-containing protein [Halorubrum sp. SP9]SFR30293.1 hypothetical protein SAMN04487937_0111 [Halorubrum sodomense]